ncbi:MAG: HAD family hydrolase [Gemmatimonadota bacterium]|nr:MAG: HAD family hydrolase [Gemmatimonadota bacterium]
MGDISVGAPLSVRVRVLFDIDGTLLLTDGAGRTAIRAALEAVYGTAGDLEDYTFHGKTDPQIVVELMTGAGLPKAEVRRLMPEVWPAYLDRLEGELAVRRSEGRIKLLPGIVDLLETLSGREDVLLGLLTGNIEEGARRKLEAAGLAAHFKIGAYGSDSEIRSEIARVAEERSRSVCGNGASAVVVVGDTPEDVRCARAVGGFAMAVATGRHGIEELVAAGADAVFEDFSDTEKVIHCLLTQSGKGTLTGGAGGGSGDR